MGPGLAIDRGVLRLRLRRVVRAPAVAPGRGARLVVRAVDVVFSTPVRGVVGLHGVDVPRRGWPRGFGVIALVEFSRFAPGGPRFRARTNPANQRLTREAFVPRAVPSPGSQSNGAAETFTASPIANPTPSQTDGRCTLATMFVLRGKFSELAYRHTSLSRTSCAAPPSYDTPSVFGTPRRLRRIAHKDIFAAGLRRGPPERVLESRGP